MSRIDQESMDLSKKYAINLNEDTDAVQIEA
jgi:hypothetical protein